MLHPAAIASAFLVGTLLCGTPTFADGCPAPSFAAAQSFGMGRSPRSVTVADFNMDGKPDLATANAGSPPDFSDGSISVLLGNGNGSFQSATNFGAGSYPQFVAPGDLNGDGKPDLAVANLMSDNVSVLLGNGDGTFRAAVNYDAPGNSVAISDFNGDGKPDLAAAGDGVSILLGDGDGTFQAGTVRLAGMSFSSVATGDFNRDGKADVAAANFTTDNVSVLLGNGDGTFQTAVSYPVGKGPVDVETSDLNGDGRPDLVAVNVGSFSISAISVLLGTGDGSFQAAVNYDAGTNAIIVNSVAVGDFNGDGKPDLSVVEIRYDTVAVLLGNGDGTFQPRVNYAAGSDPYSVAVGDFDGDGRPDLAVVDRESDNVFVLLNTCASLGIGLAAMHSGANLLLSWPSPSLGFILESTTSLSLTNWQPAAEAPMTNNSRLEVTVPLDQQVRYFRLRKP